jgi:rSAM/selenodomain-associated transferase 1
MRRIALFARWPEAGRVKTRLSPALPATLACDLYRALLADALAAAADAGADERFVYWANPPGRGDDAGVPAGFSAREQHGADLGERLARAFDELLPDRADRAVILGADCPALDGAGLRAALEALERHDAVLGPTRDGGYYLVGLARRAPRLFRGIAWSTASVLEQTLERAREQHLGVRLLAPLEDLDTPEDLVRWLARAAGGGRGQSRLDAALRAMGLLP